MWHREFFFFNPPETLGQQMFFVRKRSANAAAAEWFCLCESVVLTQRQQNGFVCAKA